LQVGQRSHGRCIQSQNEFEIQQHRQHIGALGQQSARILSDCLHGTEEQKTLQLHDGNLCEYMHVKECMDVSAWTTAQQQKAWSHKGAKKESSSLHKQT
jgi:hypothetical protein